VLRWSKSERATYKATALSATSKNEFFSLLIFNEVLGRFDICMQNINYEDCERASEAFKFLPFGFGAFSCDFVYCTDTCDQGMDSMELVLSLMYASH
jgi:hypothetical protein